MDVKARAVWHRPMLVVATMFLIGGYSPGCPAEAEAADSTRRVPRAGAVLETTSLEIDFSKYAVTFIELGAKSCDPCKAMQPVMRELAAEYRDQLLVVFYDLGEDNRPGDRYQVRFIPTQVFVDSNGREFKRHIGFYAREEIRELLESRGLKPVGAGASQDASQDASRPPRQKQWTPSAPRGREMRPAEERRWPGAAGRPRPFSR